MSNLVFTPDETIINVSPSKNIMQMKNGSVVFEFCRDMHPIACDLDFLYVESDQFPTYTVNNINLGRDGDNILAAPNYGVNGDNPTEGINFSRIKYKFLDVIKNLIFKYGLKNEYYKNKYGKWVNVGNVRPYFGLRNPSENIFSSLYTGHINNNIKQESLYVKVCDSEYFEFKNPNDLYKKMFEITDLSVIPATEYIVKENDSITIKDNERVTTVNASGFRYFISKGDGTYEYEKCKQITFTNIEEDTLDNVAGTDSVRFSYKLYDRDTNTRPNGNYETNNHHKLEDLLLSFVDKDGNNYTELNNLFITLNGVVVDYVLGPNANEIIIPDAVKYASYQVRDIKSGYQLENYISYSEDNNGTKIIDIDIPAEAQGMTYQFEIKIHKWENISVSHFIQPYTSEKMLKTKATEPSKSYWLEVGLDFTEPVNKDKTILLCGNTIVDKDSWTVDEYGKIILNTVSVEFDILYANLYDKMQEYLVQIYGHNAITAPKLKDYISAAYANDSIPIEEALEQAYTKYNNDLNAWMESSNSDTFHHSISPFEIIVNQFRSRVYSIIKFDTINEMDYSISVTENTKELKLNTPHRNQFRNLNWTPDDIVVMNGVVHQFVNMYDNVFEAPTKWYRLDNEGVFDDVNAYKLDVVKHYAVHDKFKRLSYGELLSGVKEGVTYYIREKSNDKIYLQCEELTEFANHWKVVSETEKNKGVDPLQVYYVKDANNVYNKVSIRIFEDGVIYYTKEFEEVYYILK